MSSINNINFCPNCGAKVIPNAQFCIDCGTSLLKEMNNFEEEKDYNFNNNPNSQAYLNENSFTNAINNSYTISNHTKYNISCPSCNRDMKRTKESTTSSKFIYFFCNYCNLIFKETKKGLKLTNEPKNTRLSSKYHLKTFPIEEWRNIFSNNYTSQEIEYLTNLKLEKITKKSCPVCNHNLALLKNDSTSIIHYFCSGCGLLLNLHNNQLYTLENCVDIYSPLWKYEQYLLSLEDMKKILNSDKNSKNKSIKLLFKQKASNWHDYSVFYEDGTIAYKLNGFRSLFHNDATLIITDKNDKEIGKIKELTVSMVPTFDVYENGKILGSIKRTYGIFTPGAVIDFKDWNVECGYNDHKFTIKSSKNNQLIAVLTKIPLTGSDTYELDIRDSNDSLYIVMFIAAMDLYRARYDENKRW